MVLGVVFGAVVNQAVSPETATEIAGYLRLISDVFLRMIKMIIAPLVLTTLTVGIAHLGGGGALGRIGVRTMAWFLTASLLSLALGLLMVNLLQPGVGFDTGLAGANGAQLAQASFSLRDFLTHVFPTSIVDAMA